MWFKKINIKYIYQGYRNVILNYFGRLDEDKKQVFKYRKNICLKCENRLKYTNQCGLCGCFIVEKTSAEYDIDSSTGLSIEGCPDIPPRW